VEERNTGAGNQQEKDHRTPGKGVQRALVVGTICSRTTYIKWNGSGGVLNRERGTNLPPEEPTPEGQKKDN